MEHCLIEQIIYTVIYIYIIYIRKKLVISIKSKVLCNDIFTLKVFLWTTSLSICCDGFQYNAGIQVGQTVYFVRLLYNEKSVRCSWGSNENRFFIYLLLYLY